MNSELLAGVAGVLLSLVFAFVPGATEWYGGLDGTRKRQVMLGLLALAALGTLAYQCRGAAACYGAQWEAYATALVTAVVANQSTFTLVSSNSARAKAARHG
jgi:hypothetical protein